MSNISLTGNESVIFVEGHHDSVFVECLVQQLRGTLRDCHVRRIEGKSSMWDDGGADFKELIQSAISSSDTTSIGLIVDADGGVTATWDLVKKHFKFPRFGIDLDGIRITPSGYQGSHDVGARSISVGIWIMPDNICEGQLEDLVMRMIPSDDLVIADAKSYIDNLIIDHLQPGDHRLPKHYAFAWLAAYLPGNSFDGAIDCNLLDFPDGDPQFDAFMGWLLRLTN